MSATWPVSLGGIQLNSGARRTVNSNVLMEQGSKRFQNRVLPGVTGQRGSKGFRDAHTVELEVELLRGFDYAGGPVVDAQADVALDEHYQYLVTNLLNASGDSEGTLTVTLGSGALVYSGPVQVVSMPFQMWSNCWAVYLELNMLRGALTRTATP